MTSPARTVVDLARSVGFEEAIFVTDAALRLGLVTATEIESALRRIGGWRGAPAARRVVAFADGRAESPGESRSRVALLRAGPPPPELQWPVRAATGEVLGYADFAWPESATVGEFDGLATYGRLLRPGETIEDAVHREKKREDAFRAEGLWVARWTWRELVPFAPVAERIRRGFRV